jgi:hypothetical protein
VWGKFLRSTRPINSTDPDGNFRDTPLENLVSTGEQIVKNLRSPSPVKPKTPGAVAAVISGAVAGALTREAFLASQRIVAETEGVVHPYDTGTGNNLRSRNPSYVYEITAKPGTKTADGPVGETGVYKYGMGTLDEGLSRLENQVRRLNRKAGAQVFEGDVLAIHPDRISARIHEAGLIQMTRLLKGPKELPGNKTAF